MKHPNRSDVVFLGSVPDQLDLFQVLEDVFRSDEQEEPSVFSGQDVLHCCPQLKTDGVKEELRNPSLSNRNDRL